MGGCAATCDPALTQCGQSCADLLTNAEHCGSCGNQCSGTTVCTAGSCVSSEAGTAGSPGSEVVATGGAGGATTAGSTGGESAND